MKADVLCDIEDSIFLKVLLRVRLNADDNAKRNEVKLFLPFLI